MKISKEDYLNNLLDSFCKYEEKLNLLSNKAYPSKTVKDLIDKDLKMIITEFKSIIYADIKSDEKDFSEKTIIANFIWNSGSLQNISKAVANTDFKSHPLEIMNVFRDMIEDIDKDNKNDFEILTIPTEEMNFTFSEIWMKLKRFLEDKFDMNDFTVNKKLIKLTFPKNHKNNLLLSGIFFHEVGHYFVEENNLSDKIFQKIDFDSKDFLGLKSFVKPNNKKIVSQIDLISIFKNNYLDYWIKELLSDILAVYTAGPAFVFSMLDIITDLTDILDFQNGILINNNSYSHPGFGFRLNIIINALNELELIDDFPKDLKKQIDSYLEVYGSMEDKQEPITRNININKNSYLIIENNSFYNNIKEILLDLLPDMLLESKNLLGEDNIITKLRLSEAEELARRRLREVLPPNELNNKPANAISIINSGWYAKLMYKESLRDKIGKIKDENGDYDLNLLINDLLKYSLRTSRIQMRWEN